jgi:class 3 adenylate cyclase
LFADVTGSAGLGERLDVEELKEVMAAFFASMRAEIEAEGGLGELNAELLGNGDRGQQARALLVA